jgi:hypothetical protein
MKVKIETKENFSYQVVNAGSLSLCKLAQLYILHLHVSSQIKERENPKDVKDNEEKVIQKV